MVSYEHFASSLNYNNAPLITLLLRSVPSFSMPYYDIPQRHPKHQTSSFYEQ